MMNSTGIAVFDGMKSWLNKHEINVATANKLFDECQTAEDCDAVYEGYLNKQEEIGLGYDFMEGKDPQDDFAYQEQLMKLGMGEVLSKDIDGDEYISEVEYVINESGVEPSKLADLDALSEEEYNAVISSLYLHGIIDKFMGNSDGMLEAIEFAEFYKNMEQYQGDGTQVRDGILGFETSSEYPGFLIDQVIG